MNSFLQVFFKEVFFTMKKPFMWKIFFATIVLAFRTVFTYKTIFSNILLKDKC